MAAAVAVLVARALPWELLMRLLLLGMLVVLGLSLVGGAGRSALRDAASRALRPQVFLNRLDRLVSCSKDGQLRVWELSLQHCSQVVAGFRGEVWSLDVDPGETRLAVGAQHAPAPGACAHIARLRPHC
jgi:hypothetical protein